MDRVWWRASVKFGGDRRFSFLASDHSPFFSPKSLLLQGISELPHEILHTVRRVFRAPKLFFFKRSSVKWRFSGPVGLRNGPFRKMANFSRIRQKIEKKLISLVVKVVREFGEN